MFLALLSLKSISFTLASRYRASPLNSNHLPTLAEMSGFRSCVARLAPLLVLALAGVHAASAYVVTMRTCASFRGTAGTCGERCVDKATIEWCHADGVCHPSHSDCTGMLDLGGGLAHGLAEDPCADNVMDALPMPLRTQRYRDFVVAGAQQMLKARWSGHDALSAIKVADEMLRSRESCVHACHAPQLTHERLLCTLTQLCTTPETPLKWKRKRKRSVRQSMIRRRSRRRRRGRRVSRLF